MYKRLGGMLFCMVCRLKILSNSEIIRVIKRNSENIGKNREKRYNSPKLSEKYKKILIIAKSLTNAVYML